MPWLIVLAGRDAIAWVLANERMAVNPRIRTLPKKGDAVVLYATRGAYGNPNSGEAQIIAIGAVLQDPTAGDVAVAGRTYARSFALRLDAIAEPRRGLPFAPLIPKLRFITKKENWGGALRRPVVPLPEADFRLIDKKFRAYCARANATGRG